MSSAANAASASLPSTSPVPYHCFEESTFPTCRKLQSTSIAVKTNFGPCSALNSEFLVYSPTTTRIRSLNTSNASGKVFDPSYHSEVSEIAFQPHSNLLASCGVAGDLELRDIAGEDVAHPVIRVSHEDVLFSHLAWHPTGRVLVAVGSDHTIYCWSVSDLLSRNSTALLHSTDAESVLSAVHAAFSRVQHDTEIVDLAFDEGGDLYFLDDAGMLHHVLEYTHTEPIELDDADFESQDAISLAFWNQCAVVGYEGNSIVRVFGDRQMEDDHALLRPLQCLEMRAAVEGADSESDFQLSFLPGGQSANSPALLVATHPLQPGARVFLFSGSHFTYMAEFTLDTNVLHHAAQWENDKLRLLCCQREQGQPRSLLSLFELPETSQVVRNGHALSGTGPSPSESLTSETGDDTAASVPSSETRATQPAPVDAKAGQGQPAESTGPRAYTKNSLPDRLKRLIQSRMAKFCGALIQYQEERERVMREEIVSSLQSFFEDAIQQSVKGQLHTIIEQVTQDMQRALSAELQKENFMHVLHQEMYDYFTTIMGPAIENSFRAMFQQLNQVFEQGVAMHFDLLQEQSSATSMQGAVDSLNAVCDNIMGEIGTASMYEEANDAAFLEDDEDDEDEEEVVAPVSVVPMPVDEGEEEEEEEEDEPEEPESQMSVREKVQQNIDDGSYAMALRIALSDPGIEPLLKALGQIEYSRGWQEQIDADLTLHMISRLLQDLTLHTTSQIRFVGVLLNHLRLESSPMLSSRAPFILEQFALQIERQRAHLQDANVSVALNGLVTALRTKLGVHQTHPNEVPDSDHGQGPTQRPPSSPFTILQRNAHMPFPQQPPNSAMHRNNIPVGSLFAPQGGNPSSGPGGPPLAGNRANPFAPIPNYGFPPQARPGPFPEATVKQ